MLIAGFPAEMFATNCYVVATQPGAECVVVDPGIGVQATLDGILREHRLKPVAVLLTHGHLDHTFSVTPVCGARDVPAYIHPLDRYRLEDPASTLGPQLQMLFPAGLAWSEPDEVRELTDGAVIQLAGLEITVDHAPGHTEGSVLFRMPGDEATAPTCLSGDVLFAGSVGRTDLMGGDQAAMERSLRDKVLPLADDTVVLPGHGPQTTIGLERTTNPFLLSAAEHGHRDAPHRGL